MSTPAPHRAEYDDIAADYAASKQLPYRVLVEAPTLFALAGDVRGKTVLDLPCGDGTYARAFARRGAAVLGVDLSSSMIERARASESEAPLGISYRVGDAASLGTVGAFDLVVACYLFNYARTAAELLAFARTAAANLKPGGRLVGINDNPLTAFGGLQSYTEYGFLRDVETPVHEGSRIRYSFPKPDGTTFGFDNFWLSPNTYRDAFAEAGFASFDFVALQAELTEGQDPAFWQAFLSDCPLIGLVAKRRG
jgi:2-polyprenyl-3-methyl-5-hydroxy-6-metoxy-1,4-benzoquinol methylase